MTITLQYRTDDQWHITDEAAITAMCPANFRTVGYDPTKWGATVVGSIELPEFVHRCEMNGHTVALTVTA